MSHTHIASNTARHQSRLKGALALTSAFLLLEVVAGSPRAVSRCLRMRGTC